MLRTDPLRISIMERRSSERRAAERRGLERRAATNPTMGEFYISGLQDGVTVYGLNKRQGERRHTERRTNGRRAGVPAGSSASGRGIGVALR